LHGHDLITICAILAAGFACQWLAWRIKLPAILFLLLAGILAGPTLHWLAPNDLFGELLVPLVSIGVAIILFEGSLTLKFSEIRGHGAVVRNLVTFGVLITWAGSALTAYFLFDWDARLAALFGAIVTVSGPTVVMPLLRSVRPVQSVSSVLRWEAILIDPIGAILGLLVFDFILASEAADGLLEASHTVVTMVAAGALLGAAGGYLFGLAMRKRLIPDFLRNFAALAAVLVVFAASESIHGESGLLAVTIMGIWLANTRRLDLEDILDFKENLTLVLVAGLFIVLAARLDFAALTKIGSMAIVMVLVLQFVIGPLRALVCSAGSNLRWQEILFLGWVFPRGIVAAAISAIFALRLEKIGYAGSEELVPLVYSVILGTVAIQSLTSKTLAKLLGVAEPDPTGVLVVGSNPAALAIAEALHKNGQSVLLADSYWAGIKDARMRGLTTFYGSAVSRYADRNMDLTGLGNLLSLSRRPGLNELACVRFAQEFGRDNVYTLSDESEREHRKHRVTGESRGRVLFGGEHSLEDLLESLASGAKIKTTELTDEFDFAEYQSRNLDSLLIFATDKSGRVHFPTNDGGTSPGPGWTVSAMVRSAKQA